MRKEIPSIYSSGYSPFLAKQNNIDSSSTPSLQPPQEHTFVNPSKKPTISLKRRFSEFEPEIPIQYPANIPSKNINTERKIQVPPTNPQYISSLAHYLANNAKKDLLELNEPDIYKFKLNPDSNHRKIVDLTSNFSSINDPLQIEILNELLKMKEVHSTKLFAILIKELSRKDQIKYLKSQHTGDLLTAAQNSLSNAIDQTNDEIEQGKLNIFFNEIDNITKINNDISDTRLPHKKLKKVLGEMIGNEGEKNCQNLQKPLGVTNQAINLINLIKEEKHDEFISNFNSLPLQSTDTKQLTQHEFLSSINELEFKIFQKYLLAIPTQAWQEILSLFTQPNIPSHEYTLGTRRHSTLVISIRARFQSWALYPMDTYLNGENQYKQFCNFLEKMDTHHELSMDIYTVILEEFLKTSEKIKKLPDLPIISMQSLLDKTRDVRLRLEGIHSDQLKENKNRIPAALEEAIVRTKGIIEFLEKSIEDAQQRMHQVSLTSLSSDNGPTEELNNSALHLPQIPPNDTSISVPGIVPPEENYIKETHSDLIFGHSDDEFTFFA